MGGPGQFPPPPPRGGGPNGPGWGVPEPPPAQPGQPGQPWQPLQPGQPGQPWQPGLPPHSGLPPQPPQRRRRRWIVLVLVLVVLVGLGGCAAGAIYLGSQLAGSMTAPVDTANGFLDAARAGDDVSDVVCDPGTDVDPAVATSTDQRLLDVHVSNNRLADVGGSLILESGDRVPIELHLRRRDGEWCVADVRVATGR